MSSPNKEPIATMKVTFPRYILAELNTHRMFSRSSASSRAIPFRKMVKAVEEHPFIPLAWQKDHSGMQGTEYLTDYDSFTLRNSDTGESHDVGRAEVAEAQWLSARDNAVEWAKMENELGVTKQICNRLLEPFMWHTALITATEWENFFYLRCPQYKVAGVCYRSRKDAIRAFTPDTQLEGIPESGIQEYNDLLGWLSINQGAADIHISLLAEAMWDCLNESTPRELKAGEWHMPYGDQINTDELHTTARNLKDMPILWTEPYISKWKLKVATARCAQISYTLMDDQDKPLDYAKLIGLHDRLVASGHWSPMEHCAQAMSSIEYEQDYLRLEGYEKSQHGWCGNFRSWIQYRKTFQQENRTL